MESIIYERPGLGDSTHDGKELVSSKRFAFVLYIALTIMLFAGLFGGYFVLEGNNDIWPPTGTPQLSFMNMLPENLTMIASVLVLIAAMSYLKKGDFRKFQNYILGGAGLSVLFVFAMAMEYWRLIAGGVSLDTVFGGMYFIITGVFLAHFLGGVIALFRFANKAKKFPAANGIRNGFANTLNWHYLMLALWACIVMLVYMG
jgi:heme/copper-type cytochrome/quinol oxidase subunit 3